jgi:hypothetical protein
MIDTAQLRQRIQRDIFDYQQLVACLDGFSKPRDKIRRLLSRGGFVRVKKGLYVFCEPFRQGPVSRQLLANLIYGPSYVSLDYGLSHHGLIPERVNAVTSVTPGRSREFGTPFGVFSYRHLCGSRYAAGATLEQEGDASFLIASPEKALADKVWADKRFSGSRLADYEPYLLDDLRMDEIRLAGLDSSRLQVVARAYDSQRIHLLVRYLLTLRERLDA